MRVVQNSERSSESGVTMIFVALTMVVLIGAAAITIDLGNGWVTRRNLITATDAAALAAAQEYALGGNGCDPSIADDYVYKNNADAINIDCDPNGTASSGYVTVYAEANVQTWFASVIGGGDYLAGSASTVRWGGALTVEGLRPIALCAQAPGIEAWLDDNGSAPTVTVNFSNDGQPDLCNNGTNVPGNWGLLDFDGVGGNDTKEWVNNGYPGEVSAGSPDADCSAEPEHCYPPQTGELTQVKAELTALKNNETEFVLPIINYALSAGGSNTQFHIMGFARVKIVDLKLTGQEKDRFITIQFLSGLIQGDCCSNASGPNNVQVIAPCAVDNRNVGSCSS